MLFVENENQSSAIKNVMYNAHTRSLKVQFIGGQLYEYQNVPVEVYDAFCHAESLGKFFNENIKTKFDKGEMING